MLDDHDRRLLLEIARTSLARHLDPDTGAPRSERPDALEQHAGAFVTLRTSDGRLRGCIGRTWADQPVRDVVAEMAVAAGTRDPRFPPVGSAELEGLEVEVSVLGAVRPCQPDDVLVGRDGLVIEEGFRRGLLLPQVAVEQGWDREEFLDATCRKAALPAGAWRRGAQLYRFEAVHFAEGELE